LFVSSLDDPSDHLGAAGSSNFRECLPGGSASPMKSEPERASFHNVMAGPVPAIHVLAVRNEERGCPGHARAWRPLV